MTCNSTYNRTASLAILIILSIFLISSCSTRPYKMKRAERLYRQGQIFLSQGEQERAIAKFKESIALSEMIGFKAGIAHNLNEMAIIHTSRGEHVKTREILTETLAIYKGLNMKPEVSKTLNNIASTYARERNFDEVIRRYKELVEWDKEIKNDLGVAITLYNMGLIYQNHLRQLEEAKKNYAESLKIFNNLKNDKFIQIVEKNLESLQP